MDRKKEGGELVEEVRELRKMMIELVLVLKRMVRGMETRWEAGREHVGEEVRTEREGAGKESGEEGERREKEERKGREEGRKAEESRIGKGKTTEGRKESREKRGEESGVEGERREKEVKVEEPRIGKGKIS